MCARIGRILQASQPGKARQPPAAKPTEQAAAEASQPPASTGRRAFLGSSPSLPPSRRIAYQRQAAALPPSPCPLAETSASKSSSRSECVQTPRPSPASTSCSPLTRLGNPPPFPCAAARPSDAAVWTHDGPEDTRTAVRAPQAPFDALISSNRQDLEKGLTAACFRTPSPARHSVSSPTSPRPHSRRDYRIQRDILAGDLR